MSLHFDFPGWRADVGAAAAARREPTAAAAWGAAAAADLQDLSSGGEDDDAGDAAAGAADGAAAAADGAAAAAATAAGSAAAERGPAPGARCAPAVACPDAVLLLVASSLSLADAASMACVCTAWLAALRGGPEPWRQHRVALLGAAARPAAAVLPPSLVRSELLALKTGLAATAVCGAFGPMRRGYEAVLEALEGIWAAVSAAPPPAGSGRRITHVDELWDDDAARGRRGGGAPPGDGAAPPGAGGAPLDGRALRRMVGKLSQADWALAFRGVGVALAARADDIAERLRAELAAAPRGDVAAAGADPHHAQHAAAAADGGAWAVSAASQLAERGGAGLLPAIEASAGGATAGELLAAEPELLAAATARGPRPEAGLALLRALLAAWGRYRRWLDGVTAACGLLGARVAAARALQQAEGASRPGAPAASIPHLRDKGVLCFRWVLLAHGLRRPLAQAGLWLAAGAAAEPAAWRAGAGLSDADLELLTQLRKLLRELDVADDGSEPPARHTHAKFRRVWGALLTRERRRHTLVLG
ncbi:hypothetical protein HT031_003507 [Scenedesmus sp. PABB004]|nr:hypothetical protein HT031_003507 [Scenedesmus sp. PABB004]